MIETDYVEEFAAGFIFLDTLEERLEELEDVVEGYDGYELSDPSYQDALTELSAFEEIVRDIRERSEYCTDLMYSLDNYTFEDLLDRLYAEITKFIDGYFSNDEIDAALTSYQKQRDVVRVGISSFDASYVELARVSLINDFQKCVVLLSHGNVLYMLTKMEVSIDLLID